jgi:hypothetical protein
MTNGRFLAGAALPDGRTVAVHLSGKVRDGCSSKLDRRVSEKDSGSSTDDRRELVRVDVTQ